MLHLQKTQAIISYSITALRWLTDTNPWGGCVIKKKFSDNFRIQTATPFSKIFFFSVKKKRAPTWLRRSTNSISRFIGCVATTSAISSSGRLINFQWIAYQDVKSSDGFSIRRLIPLYTTGTKCIDQKYETVSRIASRTIITRNLEKRNCLQITL